MLKKFKIFSLIVFALFCSLCSLISVNAASWTIISSKSSVSGGATFNVRITGGVAGRFDISVTNGKASTSRIFKETTSSDVSFSVTAGSSGSVYVKVTASDVTDSNYNTVSGSDDVSVSIINNSTGDGSRGNSPGSKYNNSSSNSKDLSSNYFLKSLSVEGGKLSPDFKKDIKEYTLEVDESIEKIKIYAEAEDKNAKVNGTGEKEIKDATSFQVAVTAENGKVNTYTLKISYKDEHPITVKIGKKTYTVVKRKSLLKEFDDYKLTTIKINGIEVPALYNKTTKLTLVGLKYKDKVILFRYDKEKNQYEEYIEYDFKNVKLVLFSLDQKKVPNGYKSYKIKINDYNTNVYKLRKSSNYSLIYGMNVKTGKKSMYLHDSKENTVQRYTNEALESLEEENAKYFKTCIGLCIGIVFLIIVVLVVITKKEKRNKKIQKIKKNLEKNDK